MSIYKDRIIEATKQMSEELIKEDPSIIVAEIAKKYLELYGDSDLSEEEKNFMREYIREGEEKKDFLKKGVLKWKD